MAALQAELFLWSTQKDVVSNPPIGFHHYHDKEPGPEITTYREERQAHDEARDIAWVLKNKRPEKLRDSMKDVEDLLITYKCIHFRWRTRRLIQILLSNGCLVAYVLSAHCGDVERIFVDKTLVGKLSSERVSDAILMDSFILVTYSDLAKLDYIHFTKKLPTGDAIKKFEKLSTFDPKVSQLDLPGPQTTRRLDRKITLSANEDLVISWWHNSSQDAWPWAPMTTDRERANIVLISINGTKVDILSYIRTESDPLSVRFSQLLPNLIHMLEKVTASGNQFPVEVSTYEVNKNRIQRLTVACIPLKAPFAACCRSPNEDRLIIAAENGTLVMYDEEKKVTQTEQITVPPIHLAWHPDGSIIFVSSTRGDIQVLDLAMNVLPAQIASESIDAAKITRLSQYFRIAPTVCHLSWCPCEVLATDYMSDSADTLLIIFEKGPLAMIQFKLGVHNPNRLTAVQLVNQYIQRRQLDEAVNLLCTLNWNTDPTSCFQSLMAIMVHLLRFPLNVHRETQLETTLGCFYAPTRPLSEAIVLEYRDPISRLARRFFHHLLRYSRFDKAFLLAVDIGQHDLFVDIHHVALDHGETVLAEVARRKARQIHAEQNNSDSTESLSSYGDGVSQDGDSASPRQQQYYETDLDEPFDPAGEMRV